MRSLGSRQPLLNVLEQSHQIRDVLVVDVSLRDLKGLNLVLRTLQRRQRPKLVTHHLSHIGPGNATNGTMSARSNMSSDANT
jgi:hypothetical protein